MSEIGSFCLRWAEASPVCSPNALTRCLRGLLEANPQMPKALTGTGPILVERWAKPARR